MLRINNIVIFETKNRFLIFFILIMLVSFTSCQNGDINTLNEIYVDNIEKISTSSIDQLFDNIKYIQLETNKDAIIGDINKIILYDNKLFASDGSRIIVFDNKGKYLFKIEKLGRGPGEYTDITDLIISNNTIILISRMTKKLITYDISGNFIKEYPLYYWASHMCVLSDSLLVINADYVITPENSHKFHVLNINSFEEVYSYYPISEAKSNYMNITGQNNFSYVNRNPVFNESMNNTIYDITDSALIPRNLLILANHNPPESFYERNYNNVFELVQNFDRNSYASGTNFYLEGKESILFSFTYNKAVLLCSFNKKSMSYNILEGINITTKENETYNFKAEEILLSPQINGMIVSSVFMNDDPSDNSNPVVIIMDIK